MRYPAFVAEIAREEHRPKVLTGVFTGYATVAVLLVLVIVGTELAVFSSGPWAYALIAVKLTTNTAAWWAWRTRILYVELSALNILADVLLMTGAVYFTGGLLSPIAPIYFVEIAVMALLTNAGLTILTTAGAFAMYATMGILIHVGVLPQLPSPLGFAEAPSIGQLVVQLTFIAAVMFAPAAYLSIMVDRLRSSERALAQRATELIAASEAKSEFTRNVTHELRTPLHAILGVTEVLDEEVYGPITGPQRHAFGAIRKNARSLLEMIDALLVIARAEALRLEVTATPIALDEVLEEVAATGRMLVGDKPLAIEARAADDLPAVETDRDKLVQILVNLLANAIKFTPDDGRVHLEASPTDDGVSIVVRDTGVGIPAAFLPKIFEPYHQADGSLRRAHGGAGIGLAVVKTLSDALGIDVAVESTEGVGSTFTLRVPPRIPSSAADAAEGADPPPEALRESAQTA